MDNPVECSSLLTIACRFFPHDQWLVTHVDPAWKTKQVKLWLLSKCFSSSLPPISPPRAHRPPSPITFAPDPRHRPISPITFAPASPDPRPGQGLAQSDAPSDPDSGWEDQLDSEEDSIHPLLDQRLRPRTNLYSPRSSRPVPSTDPIDSSPIFSHNPTVAVPPPQAALKRTPSRRLPPDINLGDAYTLIRFSTGQALEDDFNFSWYNLCPFELLEMHRAGLIMTLPREVNLYVQPYFEAKVMALRVVWQRSHRNNADNPAKRKTRLEWRERWVIIHDGIFNLCRGRNDSTPSHHLPLADLMALRGAAQLEKTLSVTDDQRIICAKFRVKTDKSTKATPPLIDSTEHKHGLGTERPEQTVSSYAYAFSGGSSRKAKTKKIRKPDTFSTTKVESKTAEAPSIHHSASLGAMAAASLEPKTLSKHSSGTSLRLPRLNTSSTSRAKLMRTSTTLRKAQESLKAQAKQAGPSKVKLEDESTPPATNTPPEPLLPSFNYEDLSKILTIGHELGAEEPQEDDDDTLSNLSSPVFAAPPSPLYAPPSSLLYNFDFDDDDDFGEDEERGNEADADGEGDAEPWNQAPNPEELRKTTKPEENYKHKSKVEDAEETAPDGGEWVVLDMVNDDAYNSVLRILHRHFPAPMSSSFVDSRTLASLDTPAHTPPSSLRDNQSSVINTPHSPFPEGGKIWDDAASRMSSNFTVSSSLPNSPVSTSRNSYMTRRTKSQSPPRNTDSFSTLTLGSMSTQRQDSFHKYHSRSGAARLAPLPYPEWRVDLVGKARIAGLGLVGKAMEHVHRQSEKPYMARSQRPRRRSSRKSPVSGRSRGRSSGPRRRTAVLEEHADATDTTGSDKKGNSEDSLDALKKTRHRNGVSASGEGDIEDDEDSALESSEVEWRGWVRDLNRQAAVQRQQQRKSLQIDSALSVSSASMDDESYVASPTDADHFPAFNPNTHRNQQSRIALEPTAVVSVPPTTLINTLNSTPTSKPSSPPPQPNTASTVTTAAPFSAVSSHPSTSPSSADSVANRYKSTRATLTSNFSPVDQLSSATSTSSPPAITAHDAHHKVGNGQLNSHAFLYGTWKSDMGVSLRVQESSQRKRDTVHGTPALPKSVINPGTGRLAFRGLSSLPPNHLPSLSSATTTSVQTTAAPHEVSPPPPTVKISPPSIKSVNSGSGLNNMLSGATGLSRRSSSAGSDVMKKDSSGKGNVLSKKKNNDEEQQGTAITGKMLQEVKKGKEKARDDEESVGERSREPLVQDLPSDGKRRRPKLSLATPGSSPFSSSSSTAIPKLGSRPHSPEVSSNRSAIPIIRHMKSKSKDITASRLSISPKAEPQPSSELYDGGLPPTRRQSPPTVQSSTINKGTNKKKGLVTFGSERFYTGVESALEFADGNLS